jgi:deoxycytidine triphosphate deaminase
LRRSAVRLRHIDLHLDKAVSLSPKEFALGFTKERISLDKDLCGFMEGRARLAKLGVSVEQSSTFIEPGSSGKMALELFNASEEKVELSAGQIIAKMYLMKVVDKL